jgi:hypothetical protein
MFFAYRIGGPLQPNHGTSGDILSATASGSRAADTNHGQIPAPQSERLPRVTRGEGLEHDRLQRLLARPEYAHLQNWSKTETPIALQLVEITGLPITGKNLKILVDRVETASGEKCPRDCRRLECLKVDWLYKHRQYLPHKPALTPPSSPVTPVPIPPVPAQPGPAPAPPPAAPAGPEIPDESFDPPIHFDDYDADFSDNWPPPWL